VPPVLNHIGELDEDLPFLREIEAGLRGAGKDVTVHVYPGAKHWFDEPSRPEYDAAARALAWERTLSFLRKHLG
jgi:carboxymethylenebutenolidase